VTLLPRHAHDLPQPRALPRPARVANAAAQRVSSLVHSGQAWISTLRYKALAWVLGIMLAAVATVSFIGGGWVPVLGVALAAAAVSVHRLAAGLDRPRCMQCGTGLDGQPGSAYGVVCPACGGVNHPRSLGDGDDHIGHA
jgi:hypothetical protein